MHTVPVLHVMLQDSHESLERVHASKEHWPAHLDLVHNVDNEVDHYIKE